jgi:hypothetical protein
LPFAVCAAGFVEDTAKCAQCPIGSYCRGGNGNGADNTASNSTSSSNIGTTDDGLTGGARSYIESCGDGTVIKTTMKGSTSEAACGELLLHVGIGLSRAP